MIEKLRLQSKNPSYRRVAGETSTHSFYNIISTRTTTTTTDNTIVEGVWDDHDYAFNDAGKSIFSSREEMQSRKMEYLKFLRVDLRENHERYHTRDGLYSSHLFRSTTSSKHNALVIFLDTRSQRDDHVVPSVATNHWIPLSALIAAMGRWICASFGIGKEYDGDILGENQWKWFENELAEYARNASSVIVVSSIQMFTSNPIVESWSHFPKSQQRFLNLIRDYKPRGLVVLSGDVHYAEIIAGPSDILEVTSSGMTHTCTGQWFGFFCPWMLSRFYKHRRDIESVYTEFNWGTSLFFFPFFPCESNLTQLYNNRYRGFRLGFRYCSSLDSRQKKYNCS